MGQMEVLDPLLPRNPCCWNWNRPAISQGTFPTDPTMLARFFEKISVHRQVLRTMRTQRSVEGLRGWIRFAWILMGCAAPAQGSKTGLRAGIGTGRSDGRPGLSSAHSSGSSGHLLLVPGQHRSGAREWVPSMRSPDAANHCLIMDGWRRDFPALGTNVAPERLPLDQVSVR